MYAMVKANSGLRGSIQDVVIPTPVFTAFVFFFAGVLLGPAFWVATEKGSKALARIASERIK